MSTEELKASVKQRLEETNDEEILQAIDFLLNAVDDREPLQLEPWQLARIEQSKREYAEGKFKTQDEVFKKYRI